MKKDEKLDLLQTKELVELFLSEEEKNIQAIKKEKQKITKAISEIKKKIDLGGRVIYIGAGTSGRLGLLDAVECKPTFSTNIFIGVIAGGKNAFIQAKEGAEDDVKAPIADLKKIKLSSKDVLVGIAASGETPYTLSAIKYAKKLKALTVGISSSKNSTLANLVKFDISPNTGNEIIQGSSRLKSGTAQKIILNMISSISMIQSGKVYDNLMVDVQPTNKKLVKRAINIVAKVCKIPFKEAKNLFYKANKKPTIAIIMNQKKCSKSQAEKLLKSSQNLREAIKN